MTPVQIDRLLRHAGYPRHDDRTRMTRYSMGYTVAGNLMSLDLEGRQMPGESYVLVGHDAGPDGRPAEVGALAKYVVTLEAAGYTAVQIETVTELEGEEYRSLWLLVTKDDDRGSAPRRGPVMPAAEALPPRVAHVLHALMARRADAGRSVTAAQVCEYDSEALTVQATAAALTHARRLNLADGCAGWWFATEKAWAMRPELEERYRREVN